MRILIVSQYFWPENFRINDLAVEWVRRGHVVTVLTGRPNYPDGVIHPVYRADPNAFARHQGVEIIRLPIIPRGTRSLSLVLNFISYAVLGSILGPLFLRRREFDIIFCCQLSPVFIAIPALVLRLMKRIPVVLWVLDLWPESLTAVGVVKSRLVLSVVRLVSDHIYRKCDLVLGQSKGICRFLIDRTGRLSRVKYLPSWAEDVFQDERVSPDPSVPLDPTRFSILFAGNVGDAQDFPAIVRAAELARDRARLRWIIVGDGRRLEWLRGEIVKRGLESEFVIAGRHPLERMPGFYAHADALLIPLRRDPAFALTIPGKVQSCMMAGLPLIAMLDGEGAREVLASGGGLVCCSGDGDGLASIAVSMSLLPISQRRDMGMNARRYCQRSFGRKKVHDRLMAWMERLRFGCAASKSL